MILKSATLRLVLIASGWACLILGFIGIFLPLLPTTPFILLAAYCFSKSSPRLHHWLIHQPRLGPMILDWEQQGSISQSAKITATVLIIGCFSFSLLFLNFSLIIKGILACIGTSVLCFIWTRPLPPRVRETIPSKNSHQDLRQMGSI